MQGSNKEWLIKSAGEIKGPYTYDEVIQGLYGKEFVVVDEISKKFNRWKYIRDEGTFEKIVLELKNGDEFRGDKTFTNSTTDVLTEDLTDKILNFSGKEKLLSSVDEQKKKNESAQGAKSKAGPANATAAKSYATERDLKIQAARFNAFRISYMLVILFLLATVFLYHDREKVLNFDELKRNALWHMNYGEYAEAKPLMEKAFSFNKQDDEFKYSYAYASFALDDYVTAQRLLEELKATAQDKRIMSLVWNLSGIISLKSYSLEDAKKAFDKSLEQSPQFTAAFYNKGVTDYLENNYDLAYQHFARSLDLGGLDGTILLSMVELNSRNSDEIKTDDARKKKVLDLLNLINRHTNTLQVYKQELMIGAAYLHFLMGNVQEMEKNIKIALDIDPDLTSDHILDGTFYRGLVTWDRMSEWIKKMRDTNTENENLRTLYGFSMFSGSEKLKGKDIIEGLLKSDFSNISNQIINGYILFSLSMNEEAKAALGPVLASSNHRSLGHIIMGQIYLKEGNSKMAIGEFEKSLRVSKQNISALTGLSYAYSLEKEKEQALKYLKEVYRLAPKYKPGLGLKKAFDQDE